MVRSTIYVCLAFIKALDLIPGSSITPCSTTFLFWVSQTTFPIKKSTTFPAWANCLYFWAAAGHVHGDCCQPAYFADNIPKTLNGPPTHAIGALPNLNTEIL